MEGAQIELASLQQDHAIGIPVSGGVPPYPQALPGQIQGPSTASVEWSTGLCDCCEDESNCFMTCFCPCVVVGRIAEILDRGTPARTVSAVIYSAVVCVGCSWIYSCSYSYRAKLRGIYSLEEAPCKDCCVPCFCDICAICQEYRELRFRGVEPAIGWHGTFNGGIEEDPYLRRLLFQACIDEIGIGFVTISNYQVTAS